MVGFVLVVDMTQVVKNYINMVINRFRGINLKNMTEEEARRADEDAALGCAILGFLIIVTILGCIFL